MATTRSQTKHRQEEELAETTPRPAAVCLEEENQHRSRCGSVGSRSETRSRTSRSSRASRETLRRRAEYEAEVQLAQIKSSLVQKKLALDIAEIEEECEDLREIPVDSTENVVEEWMRSNLPSKDLETSIQNPSKVAPPQRSVNFQTEPASAEPHGAGGDTPPPHPSTCGPATNGRGVANSGSAMTSNGARLTDEAPVVYGATATTGITRQPNVHCVTMMKNYELPSFGGNPADWLLFKKMYNMTTSTYQFSEIENIARIQAALYGTAKCSVEDLLRSGSDCDSIIDALEQEYGHPNLLLECAINKIKGLPRLTADSARDLAKFTAVVRNSVSLLKNVKADGYINNPQLVNELLSKLTPIQRSQYGEFVIKQEGKYSADLRVSPSLVVLVDFLSYLSKASSYYIPLNSVQPNSTTTSHNFNPSSGNNRRVNPTNVGANRWQRDQQYFKGEQSQQSHRPTMKQRDRVHTSVEVQSTTEIKCILCAENHELPECVKFRNKSSDDKWDFIKENKLCFKCMMKNHSRYQCRAKRCDKCRASHHTLLHASRVYDTAAGTQAPVSARDRAPPTRVIDTESVTNIGERFTKTLLKVIPIIYYDNDNNEHVTFALLDDGATVSLIDESLASNLRGPTFALRIVSARGQYVTDENSRRVTTLISGPNGKCHKVSLRTIRNLDLPPQSIPASVIQNNAHLRHLDLALYENAKPMILIGQDNWEIIVNHSISRGKSGQPVASCTELGWVIHGPTGSVGGSESVNFIAERDDLHEYVKEQFELESLGIVEVSRKNAETERALEILNKTSRRVEGGWEVGLLWARDNTNLPENYNHALKRLEGIEAKMKRDESFAEAYTKQVDRLIEEKYAKLVERIPEKPVWYLPHFGVTNPNKPGKLRLVFDAAATHRGTSLNDNLLSGPDLLNSLLGVLFRFRLGPIAYTADIADMFLRVKIRVEDQGAQLFLWRGQDREKEPDVYAMDSMIFGAKSSPTSAIFILNKNACEFEQTKPDAVRAIRENHYVDDYLDSVQSFEQARQLIEDVSAIHAAGGFTIREWVTNSSELRAELPTIVPGKVSLDRSPCNTERTLGMIWIPENDILKFDLSFKKLPCDVIYNKVVPTKRQYLKFIMSVFDPLGLLYPYTIRSKILLQKIWRSGIGWDEKLKEPEINEWERWLHEVKQLVDIQVPRWCGWAEPSDLDLHVFGDASEQAYAAVAYLIGHDAEGELKVTMIVGKARVAPLKVISIPRLELQAAVLACRLACTVIEELGQRITGKYLWTDSKTVLKWIRSDPRDFQKFVSHRLAEIDRKSNTSDWRWVPSAENPADEATKLHWPTEPKLWFTGPAFLGKSKDSWPANEYEDNVCIDEERIERVCVVQQDSSLVDVSRFSTWTRAVRTVARVLLFIRICRRKQLEDVSADLLQEAEMLLIKQSQAESFPDELKVMKIGKPLPTGSKLRNLDPFIYENDNLLRVRGRLSAATQLSFDEKHPVILDGRNTTTRLLIHHFHKKALHANTSTVMNCIRERFWITNLRAAVKSVALKCQFCRIKYAQPSEPKMGDLPSARLENTRRAFVHCGIDYFGPMEVAVGRRKEKRWGVLFTCLVTRAVHLELASSLSSDSAIMAIRRFVARRGQPSVMFSDRGTNFVGADTELKAALRTLDYDKLQEDVVARGISWQFNPPAAPHMGGCWERLVRSVKTALKTTLVNRTPREEVLYTLLAEVEMLVNSRPLTYVATDPAAPVVLTPNHLLIGTASGTSLLGNFDALDLDARKSWRKSQALAEMFWGRWLKEYVPTLQKRQKWVNASRPVKVGDSVLIFDKSQPRNTWPRGVISEVYPGRDGHIRVVDVKTCNGMFKRPVVKIVVLPTDGSVIG